MPQPKTFPPFWVFCRFIFWSDLTRRALKPQGGSEKKAKHVPIRVDPFSRVIRGLFEASTTQPPSGGAVSNRGALLATDVPFMRTT